MDLKTFLNDPTNNPKGLAFKSNAERKKYIREELGLSVMKNPKDDSGCVAVYDKTVMLSGHKRGVKRTKEAEPESREEAREIVDKAKAVLKVESNTKDCTFAIFRSFTPFVHLPLGRLVLARKTS